VVPVTFDPFPDERGRVPFAVVGALLLVTSATLAAGIAARPPQSGYDAGPAVTSSWTAAHAALERAVLTASVRAARHPVVEAGDGPYGRVLNASDPFRDALRLRIYVAARRVLRESGVSVGGVNATPTLPPIHSPADARRAIGRVTLTAVRNGSALRVRLSGVTVVARRDGATVERRHRTVGVTAPTPVLAVHRRVRTFERRLHRGVFNGSGLARRVTVSLTAIAEARGLAQYGGAPVTNVVSNRHVALMTNRGVLALERATFGRADRNGLAATRRAAVDVAGRDLLAGAQNAGLSGLDGALNRSEAGPDSTHGLLQPVTAGPANPQPVPLAPVADDAFVAFTDSGGSNSLHGALARAYAVDCRVETRVGHGNESVPAPATPAGYVRIRTVRKHVVSDGQRHPETVAVSVRLQAISGVPAPANATDWLRSQAVRRAVENHRRVRSLDPSFTVHPSIPASGRRAAYRAVVRTHDALRNVTGHPDRRAFLNGHPLASLAAAVNETASSGTPRPKDAAARAALVARRAYLGRVRSRLTSRRSTLSKAQGALRGVLSSHGVPVTPPPVHGPTAPVVPMRISATPAYLSLARATPANAGDRPFYPLAARNTNLFTVPSGDIADTVLGAVGGGRSKDVRLTSAAQTLRAAERANVSRQHLRTAVNGSLQTVRNTLTGVLRTHTRLAMATRQRVVAVALDRWKTPATRALAVVNGSLPAAVASAARRRGVSRQTLLAARLRKAVRDRQRSGALGVRNETAGPVRGRVRTSVQGALADTVQRGAERILERSALRLIPKGLPVLPLPGAWYVTVNVWDVAATGRFERVVVSAPLDRPGVAAGKLRYVRANATVALDVNGDGHPERLGRDQSVDFHYHTGAVAVVPPGPPGVGDVGNADERSAGWGR